MILIDCHYEEDVSSAREQLTSNNNDLKNNTELQLHLSLMYGFAPVDYIKEIIAFDISSVANIYVYPSVITFGGYRYNYNGNGIIPRLTFTNNIQIGFNSVYMFSF
jgi:hypothetical protein